MQQSNLEREDWNELEDGFGSTPQIPEIRVEFVRLLTSGKCPQLEVFLEKVEPERRAALLGSLLPLEMAQNRQDGQEVSLEEYSRRFPKYLKIVEAAFRPKSTRVGGETEVDSADSSVIGARQKETIPQPTKADFPKEDLDDFYLVGKGQQGAVYSAWYETLGNRRAIKIPFMRAKQTNEDLEAQLTREFKLLNRLRDKGARVPHAYSKGRMRDGKPYLELEYLRIGSLQKLLEERDATRARPWQYWVAMMIDLAETLAVIHAEQIYHFDIKPDNILIDETGRPVLCDFAASADHDEFHNGCSIGVTKGYTAPELQRLKENPDASRQGDGRSDIYSLGRVFYELLSDKQLPAQTEGRGRETLGIWQTPVSRGTGIASKGLGTIGKLFDSQRKPTPLVPLQPLRQVVPDLPKSIADLIAEMLVDPIEHRIDSATEVAQRLKAALRRDANPPIKRVKTAAMWGGWVVSCVISLGLGKQADQLIYDWRCGGRFRTINFADSNMESVESFAMDWGKKRYIRADVPTLFEWLKTPRPLEGSVEISFRVRLKDKTRFGVYWGADLSHETPGVLASFSGVELTSTKITEKACRIERIEGGVPFVAVPGQSVLTAIGSDFTIERRLDANNKPLFDPCLHRKVIANPGLGQPFQAAHPLAFALPFSQGGEIHEFDVSVFFEDGLLTAISVNSERINVIDQPNVPLSGSIGFFLDSYEVFLSPPSLIRR